MTADSKIRKDKIGTTLRIGLTALLVLVAAMLLLSGCSSTGLYKSSDSKIPFSAMQFKETEGRVGQNMVAKFDIPESDLPYNGCDFSAASVSIEGTLPPGITTVPGRRTSPDLFTNYFEGVPQKAGEWVVQVKYNKISCSWKYDNQNYGDRTVTVKFRIKP
jgi:hypothetical protein